MQIDFQSDISASGQSTTTAGRCWSGSAAWKAEAGARGDGKFIRRHIIPVSNGRFDNFASGREGKA